MTAERPPHITADDPRGAQAAAEILRRHTDGKPEANITSAVRNFLTVTGSVQDEDVVEEAPPTEGSRQAVDLTALDTFIEFKRRIGTASDGAPNSQYVEQQDDYLAQSALQGRVRMGILTDGKRWLLRRWPRASDVLLTRPYAFTLEDPDRWFTLHEWLRDYALGVPESVTPNREEIAKHFGSSSPSYQRDIAALKALYQENAELETVRVKRRLWYDLLRTALDEIAYTTEGVESPLHDDTEEMEVVQASFGIDIRRLAETDPADLLLGRELYRATGLQGVLESDFFAWPNEVVGRPLLQTLARRVARFD